jgi:hypothetical protein
MTSSGIEPATFRSQLTMVPRAPYGRVQIKLYTLLISAPVGDEWLAEASAPSYTAQRYIPALKRIETRSSSTIPKLKYITTNDEA